MPSGAVRSAYDKQYHSSKADRTAPDVYKRQVQGISTRIEIGPKDIEKNKCVIVRRDTREKIVVSLDEVNEKLAEVLAVSYTHLIGFSAKLI